jgi:hypothetical protein
MSMKRHSPPHTIQLKCPWCGFVGTYTGSPRNGKGHRYCCAEHRKLYRRQYQKEYHATYQRAERKTEPPPKEPSANSPQPPILPRLDVFPGGYAAEMRRRRF